jgi:hypothetical protein
MTVQEMASTALEIAAGDAAALERFAEMEDTAFEAYVSDYRISGLMICKGCHGG